MTNYDKIILGILGAGFAACIFVASAPAITPGNTLQEIRAASFMLAENGLAICSGQFIDENTFLTAAHCIKGQDTHPAYSIVVGDQRVPVTVVVDNDKVDVAILDVVGDQTFPYITVADTAELEMGQSVINAHFPMAYGEFFLSEGTYVEARGAPLGLSVETDVSVVTVDNLPGSSGSGLYAEVGNGKYQLVGTLSGGYGTSFNYFASLEGIHVVVDGR